MHKQIFKYFPVLPAAFVLLSAAVFAVAQEPAGGKHNERPQMAMPVSPSTGPSGERKSSARYSYEFTQPAFYIRHIVIEHDVNGVGKITFQRLNEETTVEEPLQFSASTIDRIAALWQTLGFLDSAENYQSDKQFPHLGTMRLKMEEDPRTRTAEFNWTNNKTASALVDEYRRVADQAILVFDISVARENQPLNAPKLMDQFELMLKRNGLSDPEQLIPLLRDLTTDEHVPLIARNHAARLLKKIEK